LVLTRPWIPLATRTNVRAARAPRYRPTDDPNPSAPSRTQGLKARKTVSTRRASVVARAALKPSDLKPTGNRILLTSTNEASGPGSSVTGKIQAAGPECKAVKAGDKVLINGFAGSDFEFSDGEKGKFVTEDDVLAVLA
jgi:chaperonin GroES